MGMNTRGSKPRSQGRTWRSWPWYGCVGCFDDCCKPCHKVIIMASQRKKFSDVLASEYDECTLLWIAISKAYHKTVVSLLEIPQSCAKPALSIIVYFIIYMIFSYKLVWLVGIFVHIDSMYWYSAHINPYWAEIPSDNKKISQHFSSATWHNFKLSNITQSYTWQNNGVCRLAAIAGTTILVPCHVVRFLQLLKIGHLSMKSTELKGRPQR